MSYLDTIRKLTVKVSPQIADFSQKRKKTSAPTLASSNFITNKEQGDWAEDLIFRAINENSTHHVAVRYGKSDNLIAGEPGFDKFYEEFQDELDSIGKRPDLLLFKKEDFDKTLGFDISNCPHQEIKAYVKKAIAGLEIRSSAFLIDQYEAEMNARIKENAKKAMALKETILTEYEDLLLQPQRKKFIAILNTINPSTLSCINFRSPSWHSTERLSELSALFKELKKAIKLTQKRHYLSITPKVEDLKVVYRWIENFGVPHFYIQVFFDKSYGISFESILSLLTDPAKEGEFYEISKDVKNQNKTTIKINTQKTIEVAYRIDEPEHKSIRKEMGRGRLLFYVTFEKGAAYLNVSNIEKLLNIKTL